jgi:uncharacterized glyoxalase superfamily metalloenzyme YdcJ
MPILFYDLGTMPILFYDLGMMPILFYDLGTMPTGTIKNVPVIKLTYFLLKIRG